MRGFVAGPRWLSKGAAALAALCAVLAFAGCGGGGTSSTSGGGSSSSAELTTPGTEASASITKAQLIKRGDVICHHADEVQEVELKAYVKQHPNEQSTDADQEKMVEAAGLPPIQVEVEELAALGAPKGEEDEVSAIVSGIEGALQAAEEDPTSVLTGKGNPFTGVDQLAGEYGFKKCNSAL